jgi:hypothetical protein
MQAGEYSRKRIDTPTKVLIAYFGGDKHNFIYARFQDNPYVRRALGDKSPNVAFLEDQTTAQGSKFP